MSRRMKIAAWCTGAVALLVSVLVIRMMNAAGQFTTIKPVNTENCRVLVNVKGPEDIVIDQTSGIAYVSTFDRLSMIKGKDGSGSRGEIMALDLNQPDETLTFQPLTGGVPSDFRPHGLSLLSSPTGPTRLFAVNHRADNKHTVEIFEIEPSGLKHVKTVHSDKFTSPNDVLAVGPDSFYVTNDGGGEVLTRLIDFGRQRERANVAYFDGTDARQVADGFVMANGINRSADGKTVYVADTLARRLSFYTRDEQTGGLTQSGSLFVGTGLDNIDVAQDGALWIAAHPKLFDLAGHLSGMDTTSPSQVIRAVPGADQGGELRTVLLDLGDKLSGASVAASFGDRYLVGSILESKMLLCRMAAKK